MKYLIVICLLTLNLLAGHVNFILIGPPGSGRRTFISYLQKNHGYYQIYPSNVPTNVPLQGGHDWPFKKTKYFYGFNFHELRGKLQTCLRRNQPFVINFFPRDIPSLEFLKDLCQFYGITETIRIVHFIVDDETCIERVNNKIVCAQCCTVFNLNSRPPKCKGVCDDCNATFLPRNLTQKTIKKQLQSYRNSVEYLMETAAQYFKCIDFLADIPLCESHLNYERFFPAPRTDG